LYDYYNLFKNFTAKRFDVDYVVNTEFEEIIIAQFYFR